MIATLKFFMIVSSSLYFVNGTQWYWGLGHQLTVVLPPALQVGFLADGCPAHTLWLLPPSAFIGGLGTGAGMGGARSTCPAHLVGSASALKLQCRGTFGGYRQVWVGVTGLREEPGWGIVCRSHIWWNGGT